MNYAVVTAKVDPQTKREAMEIAGSLGMPLSVLIKAFLKQFIRTKSVTFSTVLETPSARLLESLRKSEADVKAGRVISFQTGQDALNYLDKEIKNDKQNKQRKAAPSTIKVAFRETLALLLEDSNNPYLRNLH